MSVPDIHGQTPVLDHDTLLRCVDECFECALICTACAESGLDGEKPHELILVVRSSLACADVCVEAGRLLTRSTGPDFRLISAVLEFCADACRVCAEECERHAARHELCGSCAEACRRCRMACERLAAMFI